MSPSQASMRDHMRKKNAHDFASRVTPIGNQNCTLIVRRFAFLHRRKKISEERLSNWKPRTHAITEADVGMAMFRATQEVRRDRSANSALTSAHSYLFPLRSRRRRPASSLPAIVVIQECFPWYAGHDSE